MIEDNRVNTLRVNFMLSPKKYDRLKALGTLSEGIRKAIDDYLKKHEATPTLSQSNKGGEDRE